MSLCVKSPDVPPAETTSIRRDVDAAVRQVGGNGHKLVDKTGAAHQSEGVDKLMMISNHTEDVTCRQNTDGQRERKRRCLYLTNVNNS